jgi:hypothetical protein
LLRRIPAVKWAFTRLRPLPHSGSIDVAPSAADQSPAIVADIAEAAPALDVSISTVPLHGDAEIALAAPATEDDAAISVIAESPSATPTDIGGSGDSSRETPTNVEPVVVEEASVLPVETETAEGPELIISHDPPVELSTIVEVVGAETIGTIGIESVPVDTPALAITDDPASVAVVAVAPIVDEPCVVLADGEVLAEHVPEDSTDTGPSPTAAAATEPAPASDPAPVTAAAAEDPSDDAPSVVTDIEPAPALLSPASEIRSTPKVRARAVEPADRAALIRQRWAETGIRMWNPRLHGAGEATLNIQGSAGLLPPAPGETMPRYDKLEFRMLGGQIVCEGVIVEAPAQPGHRNFTRLAEPRPPERVRDPMRERQAAHA